MDAAADKLEIDALVRAFFAAFDNTAGPPRLDTLAGLFAPGGVVARCDGDDSRTCTVEAWTVDAFVTPRRDLLTGGALVGFSEAELSEQTSLCGNLAQRRSRYRKAGVLDGQAFSAAGTKDFQFVRTGAGWRILAVAWCDDKR